MTTPLSSWHTRAARNGGTYRLYGHEADGPGYRRYSAKCGGVYRTIAEPIDSIGPRYERVYLCGEWQWREIKEQGQ
jgi:hypothetical protein